MNAQTVSECGVCGSTRLKLVLSLGSSPPTCAMPPVGARPPTEHHHPLELLRCEDCTLVQLSVIVNPEIVFPADYPYSSGNSKALHDNFAELALLAGDHLGPDDLVVDIGANDGTLLSKFTCRTVGVEPTGQADRITGPAYQAFFTQQLAEQIRVDHGPAKVITACNVLAHVDDINDVMAGIRVLLADDGILITENHDLAAVVDGGQWDTVYHEHLRYWSPESFNTLLRAHGLGCIRLERIATHGGSFRTVASHGEHMIEPPRRNYDFGRLARRAAAARTAIRHDLAGQIWGIGATARATTIINYCGLNNDDIEYVCEVPGSDKIGRYIPGTRIPVIDETRLFEQQPPRVLLFSWHLADSIVPKLRDHGYEGTVMVPLPKAQHRYPALWMNKTPQATFG